MNDPAPRPTRCLIALGSNLGDRLGHLLDALTRLQAKDLVTRTGLQNNLYRFKIDLIRRWIAITRPAL